VMLDLLTVKFLLSYSTRPLQIFGLMGLISGAAGTVIGLILSYQRLVLKTAIGNRPLLLLAVVLLVVLLAAVSGSLDKFREHLQQMFGLTILSRDNVVGFWEAYQPAYRIPVLTIFAVLAASLALWPAQKNFGTVLSCSATVMLAAQFCRAFEGGLYMAWYLPLLLLTSFRPNLEDRVASSAVIERRAAWLVRLNERLRKSAAGMPL